MSIAQYIREIGASDHHLSMTELRKFTECDYSDQAEFFEAWVSVIPERRDEIAGALVELAEDNVDLDFRLVLSWILNDPDPQVRKIALEGLWEETNPRVMRKVIELVQTDSDYEIQASAALLLGRFAYLASIEELPETASSELQQVLRDIFFNTDNSLNVRRRILEALGYFAHTEDIQQAIKQAFASNEQMLRESALVAMGRSLQTQWLPIISNSLSEQSPALRYEAARAAGEMGEEARSLAPRIAPLVDSNDSEVALAAIWALGQIGGDLAKRTLKRIKGNRDTTRSQAAEEALDEIALEEGLF
jgi:HEAT repeat protein